MQRMRTVLIVGLMCGLGTIAEARERALEELPRDAWDLAWVWTEPIKQAAKESRRFDPISGVWFGLLEGSVKSVERTADLLLVHPEEDAPPGSQGASGQPILRYSF